MNTKVRNYCLNIIQLKSVDTTGRTSPRLVKSMEESKVADNAAFVVCGGCCVVVGGDD